ncbi:MAG: regulatory protein GemA [Acidobacteriota bacterium]
MALTARMIRTIHIAKAKTGMPEAHYRALLERFGVTSSTDPRLQPRDYHEIMAQFRALGWPPRGATEPAQGTPAGGTPAQVYAVRMLAKTHGVEPQRLAGIVQRVTGRSAAPSDPLRFCGRRDLSKLIQALTRWAWDQESPGSSTGGENHGT